MIRFLLFIFLFFALYSVLRFLVKEIFLSSKAARRSPPDSEELVQDPCCQTYVLKQSAVKKRLGGKDYYFCSEQCLARFLEDNKA